MPFFSADLRRNYCWELCRELMFGWTVSMSLITSGSSSPSPTWTMSSSSGPTTTSTSPAKACPPPLNSIKELFLKLLNQKACKFCLVSFANGPALRPSKPTTKCPRCLEESGVRCTWLDPTSLPPTNPEMFAN